MFCRKLIGCDGGCDGWFHIDCVGLSVRKAKMLGTWSCSTCKPSTGNERVQKLKATRMFLYRHNKSDVEKTVNPLISQSKDFLYDVVNPLVFRLKVFVDPFLNQTEKRVLEKYGPASMKGFQGFGKNFVQKTFKQWGYCDCCKMVTPAEQLQSNLHVFHRNLPESAILCNPCRRSGKLYKNRKQIDDKICRRSFTENLLDPGQLVDELKLGFSW